MSKRYKVIAILLIICMCVSVYPETALAQNTEDIKAPEQIQTEDTEEIADGEDSSDNLPDEKEAQEKKESDSKKAEVEEKGEAVDGSAAKEGKEESKETPDAVSIEDEDPGRGRLQGDVPEGFYDGSSTGRAIGTMATGLSHNSKFAGYTIKNGIDVSKWNGTINWTKVKQAGIEFAFVRTSYRGTDSGALATDPYAVSNMKNAAAAGVKVGAYIFSQAVSVKEAEQEAEYLLNTVKGYNITMPLVFDFEYYPGGRLEKKNLSKTAQTNICLAFCKKIKAAGYTPLVYANKSMLTSDLNASAISESYPVWLAHYTTKTNYAGDYEFWQYSSTGKVNGISGNVDMNVWYVKPGASMTYGGGTASTVSAPSSTTLSGKASSYDKIKLTWKKVSGATGYILYRYDSSSKTYKKIKTISSASTTSYTDTGRSAGTTYKYKIKVYKKAGSQTVYSKASSVVSVKTESTMTGKTNGTSIIVRKGPSTSKGKLTTLKINTGVTITGTSGSWYKISVKVNGKQKTGYVKKTYITIIRKPTLKASATSASKIKLTWTKSSGASGYQIQRYNSSKKKYVTVKTVKSGSTTSYTNSSLKKNTTYKYKIRAYKTVRGKKIYSYYSSVKSAKTKK